MGLFYNKLIFSFLTLICIVSPSIIKIPFKIVKTIFPDDNNKKMIEDMTFYIKLISFIELGTPIQKIETNFDLKISNFYISNYCYNCSYFYQYNKSSTFFKYITDNNPSGYENSFYANETFYFYDEKYNNRKEAKNMFIYLPELNDKNNCLTIGLKFPDNYNNNYQESFIQQLKHLNIINKYFWTMILYNNNLNQDYDGEFILGDILNDYYPYINNSKDYSSNNIIHTYTGNLDKKNLEWGLSFDKIYYELPKKSLNINNMVNIKDYITEFDFNLNTIIGTYEYSRNILRDYFNIYLIKKICYSNYMRGSMYKYIYCQAENFTKSDLEKFPTLYFKNNELKYIFSLDYNDLFYLTENKNYYIFNIMIINVYIGDDYDDQEVAGRKWVLGLPFWRKYQFSFDSDNKLIYFYNNNGKNYDEKDPEDNHNDINDDNNKNKNINDDDNNKKNEIEKNDKNNYIFIKVEKIIFFIILFIIFIIVFCLLIILIKKILFKKGFILTRVKKVNELKDDDYYEYSINSSKNINFIKDNATNKECEMQIKKIN